MNRRALVLVCLLAVGLVGVFSWKTAAAASEQSSDSAKVASLLNDMNTIGRSGLNSLPSVEIRRWEVPGPGIDVMRARLQETYSVDGVGRDTVELSGWIAVKHGQAHPVEGAKELNWNTAILDTEFVAMDLDGNSPVFGPVHVTLDKTRPSHGQVGRIEIPELAKHALQARLEKNDAAPKTTLPKTGAKAPAAGDSLQPGLCGAPVVVKASMPNLGLSMASKSAITWYSLVDTIPPVGHTASIAIEPVRLLDNGREVATLESGIVMFREVVRHLPLSANAVAVAAK
jgi:hypothetical protein